MPRLLLAHQLLVGERSRRRRNPTVRAAPARGSAPAAASAQTIGQRLQHDARVVIVRVREARQVLFDSPSAVTANARSSRATRLPRRHVVGETLVRLTRSGLPFCCPQEIDAASVPHRALRCGRYPRRRRRCLAANRPTTARTLSQALRDERFQHAARVRIQFAGRLTDHRIGQNVGEFPANPRRLKNGIQSM